MAKFAIFIGSTNPNPNPSPNPNPNPKSQAEKKSRSHLNPIHVFDFDSIRFISLLLLFSLFTSFMDSSSTPCPIFRCKTLMNAEKRKPASAQSAAVRRLGEAMAARAAVAYCTLGSMIYLYKLDDGCWWRVPHLQIQNQGNYVVVDFCRGLSCGSCLLLDFIANCAAMFCYTCSC